MTPRTEESSRPAVCRISTVTSFLTLFGLVCLAIVVKNNIPTVEQRRHPRDLNYTIHNIAEPQALLDADNVTISTTSATPTQIVFSWTDLDLSDEDIRKSRGQIMSSYMNKSVKPCDDFYSYACQNWDLYHPIPDDAGGIDTFEELRLELNNVLVQLLESPIREEDGDAVAKAKKLFTACMNLSAIEARQELPLLTLSSVLGGWPMITSDWNQTAFDYTELLANLRLFNNDILFGLWVGPDGQNSENNVLQLDQTELGLPSRDYYLVDLHKQSLDAYKQSMREVAMLLGGNETVVDEDVDAVVAFETEVAKILKPLEQRRNLSGLYEKLSLEAVAQEFPNLNLTTYFDMILPYNLSSPNFTIVIYARDYLTGLGEILEKTDSRTISNYLLWRFIRNRISSLDKRFERIRQDLFQVLYGRKSVPPRWKTCVNYVNSNMGMAVGALFVKNYFPEDSKNDTLSLISEIQENFEQIINDSDWLDPDTKDEARVKLSMMKREVGYPEYILNHSRIAHDYSGVNVSEEEHFENVLVFLQAAFSTEISRLGEPVDKNQWGTTPAVVNAYYSRSRNQIMLPAGILQPPFYHKALPRALNYGGIGVVIGHEITHGFDDQGRQYDSKGNLKQWWGEESLRQFQKRKQCIIDQYGNFTVEDIEQNVNGVNTQGENIADNGAIKIAYTAYNQWLIGNPEEVDTEVVPGLEELSPKQLFFLNFAQMWCGANRPEAALSKIKSAAHSPGRFRVTGSLLNLEAFSDTFGCKVCDKMSPPKRCSVW